jgi:iron complex transport system substrate-binding protein
VSAGVRSVVLWSSIVALLFSALITAQSPNTAMRLPASAGGQRVPQRIVSLAPSVTEVLFEAGVGDRVVGVTSYCKFPREALALPKVGGYLTPSYEALIALHPDLVVTLPEHEDVEIKLRVLGIPILRLDHRSLQGIVRSIERVGERCGTAAHANRAAAALRRTLAAATSTSGGARPRVLICFGRTEEFRSVTVAAPGTVYDDLIVHAGGVNALESRAVSFPVLSAEGVIRLDPDVVIELSPGGTSADALRQWQRLDSLRAVKSGRVHVFTEDFLTVPGLRFARFVDTIARAIRNGR